MLLSHRERERLADGASHDFFRRWRRPTMKTGGRLRTGVGELSVESVENVGEDDLTDRDAQAAGFAEASELVAALAAHPGNLYRILLRLAGPDARVLLRTKAALDTAEVAELERRLSKWDAASAHGGWTLPTLRAIAEQPGRRAADLAADLGLERLWFKTQVRKLKELGLTESLEIGYRLSPRGQALLANLNARAENEKARS